MTGSPETPAVLARVLVTGATGLVGNNVVRLLLPRGAEVRVLVRDPGVTRPFEGLDVQVASGDITDPTSLAAAMDGMTSVVHAAGCVLLGWHNEALHAAINHQGADNVARAARETGVRMLHVSTINSLGVGSRNKPADEHWSAGPNVACPYVLSKQAGERAVEAQIEQGLEATIVHPGLMFGPWDWKPSSGRMILEVARSFTPMAPVGGISVCDVRDVAAGIVRALEKAPTNSRYVLAGHNVTYLKLWQQIADIAGGSRPFCASGPVMRFLAGRAGDLWYRFTGREPDVNSAAVQMSDRFHYFSSARAQRDLDYAIRPMEESIQDAWQWFQEHGYV